jgi:hypothetical protein
MVANTRQFQMCQEVNFNFIYLIIEHSLASCKVLIISTLPITCIFPQTYCTLYVATSMPSNVIALTHALFLNTSNVGLPRLDTTSLIILFLILARYLYDTFNYISSRITTLQAHKNCIVNIFLHGN